MSMEKETRSATTHPSAFELERLVADDLAETGAHALKKHIASCTPCDERLRELKADIAAFRIEVPFAAFSARHQKSLEERTSKPWFFLNPMRSWGALTALGCVTALLLFMPFGSTPMDTETTRIKGGAAEITYELLNANGQYRPAMRGETRTAGDEIIVLVSPPENHHYLAVIGIDGEGTISSYYPTEQDTDVVLAPVPASGRLPTSLVLDESRGKERLFAVFSAEPETLDTILQAARNAVSAGTDLEHLSRLPLPLRFAQDSTWFEKR